MSAAHCHKERPSSVTLSFTLEELEQLRLGVCTRLDHAQAGLAAGFSDYYWKMQVDAAIAAYDKVAAAWSANA